MVHIQEKGKKDVEWRESWRKYGPNFRHVDLDGETRDSAENNQLCFDERGKVPPPFPYFFVPSMPTCFIHAMFLSLSGG